MEKVNPGLSDKDFYELEKLLEEDYVRCLAEQCRTIVRYHLNPDDRGYYRKELDRLHHELDKLEKLLKLFGKGVQSIDPEKFKTLTIL